MFIFRSLKQYHFSCSLSIFYFQFSCDISILNLYLPFFLNFIFIIIGFILIGCVLGFYFYKRNTSANSNNSNLNNFPYNSTRVSANDNSTINEITNNIRF